MHTWHLLYGFLAYLLAFSLGVRRFLTGLQKKRGQYPSPSQRQHLARHQVNKIIWVGGFLLLGLVTIGGAFLARSFFADLSILTSLCLITRWLPKEGLGNFWHWNKKYSKYAKESNILFICFLLSSVLGLGLYLSSLGLVGFDLYDWGYGAYGDDGSPILLTAVLAFTTLLLFAGQWSLAVLLLLTLSAYLLGLHPSPNLWDALLDPFLWGYGIFFLIRFFRTRSNIFSKADLNNFL